MGNFKLLPPSLSPISACRLIEELKELSVSSMRRRNPFHCLGLDSYNPFQLISTLLADAKEFNQNHGNDAAYMDKASTSLALECWKGFDGGDNFCPKTGHLEMHTYQISHHSAFILLPQPEVSTQGIIDQFPNLSDSIHHQPTATISRITEALDTTNELKALEIERAYEKFKIKKYRAVTLHESVIHLIKMAAFKDGEVKSEEIPGSIRRFLNFEMAKKMD